MADLPAETTQGGKRPVAGCDLGTPKGFGRRDGGQNGVAPGHGLVFLPRAVLLVSGCKWLVHKCVSGRNFVAVLELSIELWLPRTVL